MKNAVNLNKSLSVVLFAYFLTTGCTKETEISSANIQTQLNSDAQANAASVFTSSTKSNISITVFISCANNGNGETVTLNGTLHETYHLTTNKNKFQMKIVDNPQGISGIGDVTGIKYQGTGETEEEFSGSFINGKYEDTFVNNFRIIGQGAGNNYLVHEILHVTIHANGTITSSLDHFSVDCK